MPWKEFLIAALLGASAMSQGFDLPFAEVFGQWPASTVVAGFLGANYRYHAANGPSPDGIVIDNGDPGFSTTGTWRGQVSNV